MGPFLELPVVFEAEFIGVLIDDLQVEDAFVELRLEQLHLDGEGQGAMHLGGLEPANDVIGHLEVEPIQGLVHQVIGREHPLLVHQVAIDTGIAEALVHLGLVVIGFPVLEQELGGGAVDVRQFVGVQVRQDQGEQQRHHHEVPVLRGDAEEIAKVLGIDDAASLLGFGSCHACAAPPTGDPTNEACLPTEGRQI